MEAGDVKGGAQCGASRPSETNRKRRSVNRHSSSKVERLEEKLDGLVTLLTSSAQSTQTGHAVDRDAVASDEFRNQLTPESLQSLASTPRHSETHASRVTLPANADAEKDIRYCPGSGISLHVPVISPETSYTASGTRSATYHTPHTSSSLNFEPSMQEAEEYLKAFMNTYSTYLPFTGLSQLTTAQELRQQRPFLWLCIMMITTKSSEQQRVLGREVRLTIGREILIEGKNNFDLLLGLLVFAGWGHYHIYDKPVITSVLQMAKGLVGNLGLKRMPPKEPPQMMLEYDARGCPKPFNPTPRTIEERRAVLGCFLVSSVCASYFQRIDSLRWNHYMNECLQILAVSKDQPSDDYLVQLVKLQLVAEKVSHAPWNESSDDPNGDFKAPPHFYLRALQRQLLEVKNKIQPGMPQYELVVHEVALSKDDHFSCSLDFLRLDCLYACLNAIKNWFSVFMIIPPASYVGLSIMEFTQLAHCIIALYRISTFEWQGWDHKLVRDTANLSTILTQLIPYFAQVKTDAGLDRGVPEGRDIFSITSKTLENIKAWWDSKTAGDSTGVDTTNVDDTMADVSLDFLDDAWLQDILGTGPYRFEPIPQSFG
ncbi:hypothetical protein ACLMJK_004521 [Lecanora helva]